MPNSVVTGAGGLLPAGSYNYPYGLPNTFMFQVRPLPDPEVNCPAGAQCCERWKVQTPHRTMNVALCDGSVRSLSASIDQTTWSLLLLPRDAQPPPSDQ